MTPTRRVWIDSVVRSLLPSLAVVGLALALLAFVVDKTSKWSAGWVIWVGAFFAIVLIITGRLAFDLYMRSRWPLPRVRYCHENTLLNGDTELLLLLDPSALFGVDSLVSVYGLSSDFEVLIGIGAVITIQQEGAIQVRVLRRVSAYEAIWKKVAGNDKATLASLLIKPTVPRYIMEEYID
jgi:membrane-bound metal-dependent hydrolase YbcI (DUF457 family)